MSANENTNRGKGNLRIAFMLFQQAQSQEHFKVFTKFAIEREKMNKF
jgi:hypothetical protein